MILLPTVVLPEFGGTSLTVDRTASGYTATIGLSWFCHAYTECALATVEGSRAPMTHANRRPIRLRDGTVGWYEDHACGANCAGSATLLFERGGVRYRTSVKAGTEREAVIIANSLQPEYARP